MNLERVVLIRHAESTKSRENRHGGIGLPLTERGIAETHELAKWLFENLISNPATTKIYSGNVLQARQTSEVLSEPANIPITVDDRLRNIDLGILAGLSEEEAIKQYPDAALSLENWRRGLIPIEQVYIPNAETMFQFHSRIKGFLQDLFDDNLLCAIIVGTRSVAVAITNILLGHHKYDESGYKRYSFDPASISSFRVEKFLQCELEFLNQTNHLSRKPSYPDI